MTIEIRCLRETMDSTQLSFEMSLKILKKQHPLQPLMTLVLAYQEKR